jgi:hypothetical protein
MFSRLRIFFNSTYWRQLFHPSTWRQASLSLRRAHKDRRARMHLLGLGLMLIFPLVCLVYLAWLLQSGAIFLIIPLLIFAIPLVWWIRRNNRLNEPAHVTPQTEPAKPVEMTAEQRERFCAGLAELGLFYAVMLDRAGSELFVQYKELPPNVEIVSRRTHIDLLRRTGIWDKLYPADRDATMIADGHWETSMIQRVCLAMEPFRLIRWLLRVDFCLPVVGMQAKDDFGLAHEVVLAPDKLLSSRQLIGPEGLDIALHSAREYFYRCFAESIHRGYGTPNNENAARWASEVVTRLSGRQHDDLVIGAKLVSEADQDELLRTTRQSHARMSFLALIGNLVSQCQMLPPRFTLLGSGPESVPTAQDQAATSS